MKGIVLYITLAGVFVVVFTLATNLLIYEETKPFIYTDSAAVPGATVALVPGAALAEPNKLSPIFAERVDLAIRLYETKKVSKILVSGDNSTLAHNEVNPARLYLLRAGIPDQDIFLDHAGFDTYSSLYRARYVFGVSSMVIASQAFHLPRAVFIARALGMTTYGVTADTGPVLLVNYVREVFADEKTLFDLAIGRLPRYLGSPIPITADGRAYP